MTESENLEFSTKVASCNRMVDSKQMEFLLHCQAGVGASTKSFKEEVEQIIPKK
jgi:hypothetical protein